MILTCPMLMKKVLFLFFCGGWVGNLVWHMWLCHARWRVRMMLSWLMRGGGSGERAMCNAVVLRGKGIWLGHCWFCVCGTHTRCVHPPNSSVPSFGSFFLYSLCSSFFLFFFYFLSIIIIIISWIGLSQIVGFFLPKWYKMVLKLLKWCKHKSYY